MEKQVAYRFEEQSFSAGFDEYGDPNPGSTLRIWCLEFPISKVTPKGIWIDMYGRSRFVLLSARKVYAHTDKEQALLSYIMRKKAQIRIYEAKLKRINNAVNMALKHSGHELKGYTLKKVGAVDFEALDKDAWYSWV